MLRGQRPPAFEKTVLFLAQVLAKRQYALRGTASLVLRGLEMNVVDIDILADEETALACNTLLKDFLVAPVKYSEAEKFKSYFGQFRINDIPVEVMGEWQIKSGPAGWSAPFTAAADECGEVEVAGQPVRITKIEMELKMFALMGRWTAYQKIKKQLAPPLSSTRRVEEVNPTGFSPTEQQKLF